MEGGDAPAEGGDAPTVEKLSVWYGELKLVHKRLHDAYNATQSENKRFKTATSNVVDELLCPITQQLPVDPVMAKDGRLYERVAINEWFEKNKWKKSLPYRNADIELVRSPITNQEMELHLIDAAQIRITIQHLVQSGLVDDDQAAAVKEFFALEKAINEGDGDAMYEMGRRYRQNHWWKKGAKLHNPKCMAAYGRFLRLGHRSGWSSLADLGTRYLCEAATNVDLAAYTIGKAVLVADYLLEDDDTKAKLDEAKYWLKKVVHGECEHKIMDEADMLDAQKMFKEIEEHESAQ